MAYRMLGSLTDAEDVVQEAWLRWQRVDLATVQRPAAWLTTVTSRLAIDRLRAQRRRREEYVGPWLPEPIATDGAPGAHDRWASWAS
jgi:RNA polymerase sigma-70 factor (ECF subfamily)